MKKPMTLLGLTLLAAPVAMAQKPVWQTGHNAWGVMASYWDSADASESFGGGLKFSFGLTEDVQLELRGTHFGDFGESAEGVDVDLEVTPLEAGMALQRALAGPFELFVGGGLGYYLMDSDVSAPAGVLVGGGAGDELGFYLTTGIEWLTSTSTASYGKTEAVLFAELMYRFVNADDIRVEGGDTVRLRSADLDGIGVNAGLMIRW